MEFLEEKIIIDRTTLFFKKHADSTLSKVL